jgi:hypothetical protein
MDLFVVPTLAFNLLYGFIIVRLDRRELVHIAVTNSPTAGLAIALARGGCAGLRVIVVMPWNSEFEFVAAGAPWKAATLIARRFCR